MKLTLVILALVAAVSCSVKFKQDDTCLWPDEIQEEMEKREIAGLSIFYTRATGYTCLVYVEYKDGRESCVLP